MFVDVKSPENYRKITKKANKAYEQGGIACISNHFITLKTSNLGGLTKSVYSQGVYRADEFHYYIDGTLYKYNSQGELLDWGTPTSRAGFSGHNISHIAKIQS